MNQATTVDKKNASSDIRLTDRRALQRQCACGQHAEGGECEECKKKREQRQRKPAGRFDSKLVPAIVGNVISSPGKLLDAHTRNDMESRFGNDFTRVHLRTSSSPMKHDLNDANNAFEREADRVATSVARSSAEPHTSPSGVSPDFSRVQVHADSQAADSAAAINANAYTVGNHVVFNRSRYAPGLQSGRWLLAHELSHVLQQEATSQNNSSIQRQAFPAPPAGGGGLTREMLEQIARRLRDAMAGLGTDEESIRSSLAGRTQDQSDAIAQVYLELFGRSLISDLQDELSESELQHLGIFSPGSAPGAGGTPVEQAAGLADLVARQLRQAIEGPGTDEAAIFAALTGRTVGERDAIKQAYKRLTQRELEVDLRDELSGSELREALLLLNQGFLGAEDEVYFSIAGLGTDEDRLFRVLTIMSAGGRATVIDTIDRYAAKGYGDMLADIRDDLSGGELDRAMELIHGFTTSTTCSPEERVSGLEAISSAASLAQGAISRLDGDIAAGRLSKSVATALESNFNPGGAAGTVNVGLARQVRDVLAFTRNDLLTRSQVTCSSPVPAPCAGADPCMPNPVCGNFTYAWTCPVPGSVVRLCPAFFICGLERGHWILHEFVHHNGVQDKFYRGNPSFQGLTPIGDGSANDSLDNADSYAFFAKALVEGTP